MEPNLPKWETFRNRNVPHSANTVFPSLISRLSLSQPPTGRPVLVDEGHLLRAVVVVLDRLLFLQDARSRRPPYAIIAPANVGAKRLEPAALLLLAALLLARRGESGDCARSLHYQSPGEKRSETTLFW